jgi:hypothetical protein
MDAPRTLQQRQGDTQRKLATDKDIWVASASTAGEPCIVPLSFAWVNGLIVMVTERSHRTARNISATGAVRLCLGPTRDVVSLVGEAEVHASGEVAKELVTGYIARTNWDPTDDESMVWIVFRPRRIQAWREVNELADRLVMQDGRWLAAP